MSKVTVAATQMACSWDRDANVARAEKLIREAATRGAQVILIQELFETPYFCKDHSPRHLELAKPLEAHPAVEHFRALARELAVVLPVSVFERANNAFYNSVVIVDADGSVLGSSIPRPSARSRRIRASTRADIGSAPCRAMRPPTSCRWWPRIASAPRRA